MIWTWFINFKAAYPADYVKPAEITTKLSIKTFRRIDAEIWYQCKSFRTYSFWPLIDNRMCNAILKMFQLASQSKIS